MDLTTEIPSKSLVKNVSGRNWKSVGEPTCKKLPKNLKSSWEQRDLIRKQTLARKQLEQQLKEEKQSEIQKRKDAALVRRQKREEKALAILKESKTRKIRRSSKNKQKF